MSGIPTMVTVSGAFLKKCMNESGNPVCTYSNYIIDGNGNITWMGGCTNDPDGKIARENAERKIKEKKAAEEKADVRRAEKKAAEEKAAKKRAEKAQAEERIAETGANEISISVIGNSVENVTKSIITAMSTNTGAGVVGFDVKA